MDRDGNGGLRQVWIVYTLRMSFWIVDLKGVKIDTGNVCLSISKTVYTEEAAYARSTPG